MLSSKADLGVRETDVADPEEEEEDQRSSRRGDTYVIPVLFGVVLDDITENFADPRDGGARSHEGLDMLAPKGTPIITPVDARVRGIGVWTGAGTYVSTETSDGERHVYMHLDEVADIKVGDRLRRGDLVGFVGDTGNAKGGPAHLHFEIRINNKATDPYPRIQEELSLKEKMAILEDVLDSYDEASDLARFLVNTFESTFILAQARGIDLPRRIEKYLDEPIDALSVGGVLEVGDEGREVSALQMLLIDRGFLAISEPTGYFGPKTKAAVAALQKDIGVSPATGNYGPLTRSALQGTGGVVATKTRTSTPTSATDDVSLAAIIELFLSLNIIPAEKADAARRALASLEAGENPA